MKLTNKIASMVLLIVLVVCSACASGSRGSKGCGCPQKSGMVGY